MFGERLYVLRTEKGLSMKKAGESVGVSNAAWNKYEKNRSDPSYAILIKIADLFDVSIDYLLGRSNIRNEKSSETIKNTNAIIKKLKNGVIIDTVILTRLSSSLDEALDNYNRGIIDDDSLLNLISLLANTVMSFNKLVKQKTEQDFILYQNTMVELINEYSNMFHALKDPVHEGKN